MLTARGEAEDKFTGLSAGPTITWPSPFSRGSCCSGCRLSFGGPAPPPGGWSGWRLPKWIWKTPPPTGTGRSAPSPPRSCSCFRKLYENAGRIVTTGALCEAVCGPVWQGYESTLATHIRHLREKIEANPSRPVSIVTVKGLGYRLDLPSPKGAPR